MSVSTISSSASFGCSGKEVGDVLHAFIAQVRKLRVKSFMADRETEICFVFVLGLDTKGYLR